LDVNWNSYKDRITADGSSFRERNVNRLKQNIANNIQDSPSYKSVKINGTSSNLVVIDDKLPTKKFIKSIPSESFSAGDYVEFSDGNWLIITADLDDELYVDGEMLQCNLILKWQNSSGTTVERWCVAEKPALNSLDEGNVITTSEKVYRLKIPYDTETQNLYVGKRFLLEKANGVPLAYKMTGFDGISQEGILNAWLTQDQYNTDTDDADLMIADYVTPISTPTGQAQISGSSTMYIGGSWRYYSATFLDEDGEVLSDVTPVWSWVSLSNQTDKFVSESLADGRFRIKALLDVSLIGTKIKIKLDDTDELYHAEILVEVGDL